MMLNIHLTHVYPDGRRLFAILDAPEYGSMDEVYAALVDDKFIRGDKVNGKVIDGQCVREGSEPVIYAASSIYSVVRYTPIRAVAA